MHTKGRTKLLLPNIGLLRLHACGLIGVELLLGLAKCTLQPLGLYGSLLVSQRTVSFGIHNCLARTTKSACLRGLCITACASNICLALSCRLLYGSHLVQVRAEPDQALVPGQTVHLEVQHEGWRLFDGSGLALPQVKAQATATAGPEPVLPKLG